MLYGLGTIGSGFVHTMPFNGAAFDFSVVATMLKKEQLDAISIAFVDSRSPINIAFQIVSFIFVG